MPDSHRPGLCMCLTVRTRARDREPGSGRETRRTNGCQESCSPQEGNWQQCRRGVCMRSRIFWSQTTWSLSAPSIEFLSAHLVPQGCAQRWAPPQPRHRARSFWDLSKAKLSIEHCPAPEGSALQWMVTSGGWGGRAGAHGSSASATCHMPPPPNVVTHTDESTGRAIQPGTVYLVLESGPQQFREF